MNQNKQEQKTFEEKSQSEEWGAWKFVSDMLDNPDKYGIYPTSKCYEQIHDFVVEQKDQAIKTERNRIVEIVKKSMCDFCTYDNKLWSNSTEKYIKCTGLKHVLLKALENKGKDE